MESAEETIKKIILTITQPGEDATDGECMGKVWQILQENGYDLDSVQKAQEKGC